jgi:outer membrane protein assembly factor BamB
VNYFRAFLLTFCFLFMCVPGLSRAGGADDSDWTQFQGPNRDNKSSETDLLAQWPASGPRLLWTQHGLGEGYTSIACADGLLYTTGNVANDTVIVALDTTGEIRWRIRNGPAYRRSHPGTRSTPTLRAGLLYHENADGDVICVKAKTGDHIWSVNVLDRFNGRNIRWGLSESLLIDEGKVICTPGGEDVGVAALDTKTGDTVWACTGINEKPGYCSPIVFEYAGLRQIVTLMAESIVGLNADNGKLLWKFKNPAKFDENITSPCYHDGHIFTSTRTSGSRLLRIRVEGDSASVEQVWSEQEFQNHHEGIICLGRCFCGACMVNRHAAWKCISFQTGQLMHSDPGIGRASLCYADGMLYLMNHNGNVALVKANPKAFDIVSSFEIPKQGRGPTWAHPVVAWGRLFIRHGDFLYCYDIEAK